MAEFAVIGKPLPRVDAIEKVTGAARYAADINLPGMLWGKFLHSPYAHARIKRIDTSKAERLPGVKVVITGQNLQEGMRLATDDAVHGLRVSQGLFATDVVRYQGEKIAAVAAISPEIAEDALRLIEVEYEVLPAVTDIREAVKPEAPRVREDAKTVTLPDGTELHNIAGEAHHSVGDVEKGFAEADYIFEDTYWIPRVHQLYLEPHACVAYVDPSGKVTVWTSTQSIFGIRSGLSSSLGIPVHRINVIGTTLGGGFGGKFSLLVHPYAVILSQITRQPVKIVYSREEEFLDGRPAPAALITVKTGVKKDGTIVARQAFALWDTGCVPGATIYATGRIAGVYRIPNIKWDAYAVYTHEPGTAAYRAPGAPQGTFASETQLNRIAAELGIDPVDFRLKNMLEEGEPRPGQQHPLTHIAFKETLKAVAEKANWWNRKKGPNQGWGVAVGEWHHGSGPAAAVVSLQEDGTIRILSGIMDMTGTDTGMAQIAAEVLGVDFEDIRIIRGDTDSVPYATGSGGSVVLFSIGNAVKRGAEIVRRKVLELASQQLECSPDHLEIKNKRVQHIDNPDLSMSLAEVGQLSLRTTGGPIVGVGTFANERTQPVISAQIVKVEVDPETGRLEVLELYGSVDCGRAINPLEVEGQIEGGLVQGLSWGWMEELKYQKGQLLNPDLLDYMIPGPSDIPRIHSVIVEKESSHGAFGMKGIGEPPITPTPAALASAVADATGIWINELPLTPERIFFALQKAR